MASRILDRLQQFLNVTPGQALPQARALGTMEDDNWGILDTTTQFDEERKHRYQEYDAMDLNSSEISVALDIYAEESSQVSMEEKRTVWVTSKDPDTVIILHDMFDKIGLEDHAYGMYRAVSKYGDLFAFPMVQQKPGEQNSVTQVAPTSTSKNKFKDKNSDDDSDEDRGQNKDKFKKKKIEDSFKPFKAKDDEADAEEQDDTPQDGDGEDGDEGDQGQGQNGINLPPNAIGKPQPPTKGGANISLDQDHPEDDPHRDFGGGTGGSYYGIYKLHFLHPSTVRVRTDPSDGTRIGYDCDSLAILDINPTMDSTSPDISEMPDELKIRAQEGFSPWDIIHGRIMGRELTSEYGTSMVEGVRRSWQTLAMMETAVALARLIRGSSRLLYKIDTGAASPDEQKKIVDEFYKAVRKKEILNINDPAGNRNRIAGGLTDYISRWKPFRMMDDIFWPVPKDSASDVTVLQGSPDITGLEDIEQWKNKVRTGLGIPKAYFDQDISGWQANKALSQQDIRFAKKSERIQKAFVAFMEQLCATHLLYRGKEEFSFTVHVEPASSLALLQRLEVLQQKTQIATELISSADAFGFDKALWVKEVLRNIMGMSRSDIERLMVTTPITNPLSPGYFTGANQVGGGDPSQGGPPADMMPLGGAGQDTGGEPEDAPFSKPVSDSFSHRSMSGFTRRNSFRQMINDEVRSNPYRSMKQIEE